jgi:hypothetical protein
MLVLASCPILRRLILPRQFGNACYNGWIVLRDGHIGRHDGCAYNVKLGNIRAPKYYIFVDFRRRGYITSRSRSLL